MSMLSAGVYVQEVDASAIVPTVSNSVAFFAGEFEKGPIEQPFVVTNKKEYEDYFGKPTNYNYNQWFQGYKFLDYGNQLVISRAYLANNAISSGQNPENITAGDNTLVINEGVIIKGDVIYVTDASGASPIDTTGLTAHTVTDVVNNATTNKDTLTVVPSFTNNHTSAELVYKRDSTINSQGFVNTSSILRAPSTTQTLYKNKADFEYRLESGTIIGEGTPAATFIARDAGTTGNDIKIATCRGTDFNTSALAEAFEGINLSGLFQYAPVGEETTPGDASTYVGQYGVIISNGETQEVFVVTFDELDVDANGRSTYIENVINNNSKLVYVKAEPTTLMASYLYKDVDGNINASTGDANLVPLELTGGVNPIVTEGDIKQAYDEVLDKELYSIDVVIGNEKNQKAAQELAIAREDCIAFIGATYETVVGKRSGEAVTAIVDYINQNNLTSTMFSAFFGNYHRIYDNYAKKYRWINVAGDMAGLRANTNNNQASWWASAGLRRGVIRNIDKIAFSPSQPQRDTLYKNSINPIVSFPGEGNLCWGQKTLLNYSSAFDRVNVRGLFNTIERAMSKAAKSQVFEFNDAFTRNAILAMFNPYLTSVKAGRGITDFLVICDNTNNTPDVISRNELHVDIFIKPNYAAEFIQLTFTNVGTRSFATVVGA